jgi:hypothetical protein
MESLFLSTETNPKDSSLRYEGSPKDFVRGEWSSASHLERDTSGFATRDGNLQTGTQFVRGGVRLLRSRRLDRVGAALHGFEFFVECIIHIPCERGIGFDADVNTTDIPLITVAHRYVHPHGEATSEDVLGRG